MGGGPQSGRISKAAAPSMSIATEFGPDGVEQGPAGPGALAKLPSE